MRRLQTLASGYAPWCKERKVASAWVDAGACDAEHGGRQGTFLPASAIFTTSLHLVSKATVGMAAAGPIYSLPSPCVVVRAEDAWNSYYGCLPSLGQGTFCGQAGRPLSWN